MNSPSSQPLIAKAHQALQHLCGRLLNSLHYAQLSLVLRGTELATELQMQPH